MNRDISILFEDLKYVKTPQPMGGCMVLWVGWWMGLSFDILIFDCLLKAPQPVAGLFLGGLSLHLNHLYSIAHDNLQLAIWDTSFWTFLVKFGQKGP